MSQPSKNSLSAAPGSVTDIEGQPHFGTFEGYLSHVDLSQLRPPFAPDALARVIKHKRWQYNAIATPEILVVTATVDTTYACSAFMYAVDLKRKKVLFDQSFTGLPMLMAHVGDRPAVGLDSWFRAPGARLKTHRDNEAHPFSVEADLGRIYTRLNPPARLRATANTHGAAPALTVISPVPDGGIINITQKWAGLPTTGELTLGSDHFSLNNGLAGFDYSQGLLARRTCWRWALALGKLADGTSIGINLVEGFNEANASTNENALWFGDRLIPLSRARFEYDKQDPSKPWKITTVDGEIDLHFDSIHVHDEHKNLKLIRSYFVQPAGLFTGTIKVDGIVHDVKNLAGVTEDQDVFW